MSTYANEKASNLAQALESVFAQTRAPEQVVLVIDGPIPPEQESVIRGYCGDRRVADITVLHLPEKGGLAAAMNAGLKACSGAYVMRMDSDDICTPDRIEIQMRYALANPDVDVVSSWSEEFFEDGRACQIKVSPVAHEHVAAALRWRNVLVHPTILAKSCALRAVDGYRSKFGMLEDYDLFVRLAVKGFRFHVIPKTLVRVRSSTDQRGRRGGLRYSLNEVAFRWECTRVGFLRLHQFIATTSLYLVFRLTSGAMRKRLYAMARSEKEAS
ncbi:MAG: amylovoran biosynthesis glycosyltransferase AmsE [Verrucomicrobia bacterium]|nr:MAG: amylovoran biosynthesis glycosyltransferase AmsE [Verrucomicrobiota bacterium]